MKTVTFADVFTEAELKRAVKIANACDERHALQEIVDQIIAPNIERINAKLGQENDPKYLAYAFIYALNEYRRMQ